MEGVAQVYRMERERNRRRRRHVLWTAEKTNGFECAVANGGARGGVQARERHRMRIIFLEIREISHCAVMGELTRNSDEKASALFEKYNVIYDKISWKVHIPYMETHCSVYLFRKLPAKHDCFCRFVDVRDTILRENRSSHFSSHRRQRDERRCNESKQAKRFQELFRAHNRTWTESD